MLRGDDNPAEFFAFFVPRESTIELR